VSETLNARWPALPYAEWKGTYDTLHMWTQVVGKVALASTPPLNHCWGSALHLTPRGLTTRPLSHDSRSFTMEFDFIDHQLVIRVSDGTQGSVRLAPRTVADFYQETMAVLRAMGLAVSIWTMPVEVPSPIRFETDVDHRSYDPEFANRFWRILTRTEAVFTRSRCRFVGKASPAHFFWGSFDLALTRFSGRPAPPRDGPQFMRDAYSHEVISHGFWPGADALPEPVFYAYAAPEPAGFRQAAVRPAEAFYSQDMKEFFLPYEAVRTSSSPEDVILSFVESTYARAADLAKWDRAALERAPLSGD
jgi:hypothetical protein